MGESRLKRLAPHGQTDVLADLADVVADIHPDPGDSVLAATKALRRSAPDLVGLMPDSRTVYYWRNPGFASHVPFDDTGIHSEDAEQFARGAGTVNALRERSYAWLHPEYEAVVEDGTDLQPTGSPAVRRFLHD